MNELPQGMVVEEIGAEASPLAPPTPIQKVNALPQGMVVEDLAPKEEAPTITDEPKVEVAPKGMVVEKLPVEQPPTLAVMAQGVMSSLGEAEYLARGASAGIYGLFSKDMADQQFKRADERKEAMSTAVLTKEQQAAASIPQEIAGGLAGMGPYLASGAVAPTASLVTMAMSSGYNTAADLISKNVDLMRAEAAGFIKGAGTWLMGKAPAYTKTVPGTIIVGAGANVGQGVTTDYVIREMFPDREDLRKEFDPWDPRKRAVEAGAGSVAGLAFRQVHISGVKAAERQKAKEQTEISRIMATEVIPELSKLISDPSGPRHTGQTLESLISDGRTISELDQTTGIETVTTRAGNLKEALELILERPDVEPWQKALAEQLRRGSNYLGLHEVPVDGHPPVGQKGVYRLNDEPAPNLGEADSIGVKPTTKDLVTTVLHEAVHASLGKALQSSEGLSRTRNGGWKRADGSVITNPADILLANKVEKFNEIYTLGRNRALKAAGLSDEQIRAIGDVESYKTWLRTKLLQERVTNPENVENLKDLLYPWASMDEFAAGLTTNTTFVKSLKEHKLTDLEVGQLKVHSPKTVKHVWDAVKRVINNLLGAPSDNYYYNVALDHLAGVYDTVTPRQRADRTTEYGAVRNDLRTDFTDNAGKMSKLMLQRISKVIQLSNTKEMLVTRLMAQSTNETWRSFVASHADSIWDNYRHVVEAAENSDYSKFSESERRMIADDRTLDQFVHEDLVNHIEDGIVKKPLKQFEDLKSFGTFVFSPQILNSMKKGYTAAIMRFVNNSVYEYKSMSEIIYHDALAHYQDFNNLERKSSLKLVDTIIHYDTTRGRLSLKALNARWIPDDVLRQRGHTDAEIQAYHGITKGSEFLWDLSNQALIKRGEEPIEFIPGYMPHVMVGAYKVFVKRVVPGPRGLPEERVVAVRGFKLRQSAEKFAKELSSGKFDDEHGSYRPQIDVQTRLPYKIRHHRELEGTLMADIQDQINTYQSSLSLSPEALQVLEKMDTSNLVGKSKHTLERSDIAGYLGYEGVKNNFLERFGIGDPTNNQLLKLWQNHARNVVDFYKNTMWQKEIYEPLTEEQPLTINGTTYYGRLLKPEGKDKSVLLKHLGEFGGNFTGSNTNKFKLIDDALQDISVKIGVDPLLYREMVRGARNLLSLTKLRANPGNYVANSIQPIHTMGQLYWVNHMLRMSGMDEKDLPSPTVSFSKAIVQRVGTMSPEMLGAVGRARENHRLDAQLDYELGAKQLSPILNLLNKLSLGEVTTSIESGSRLMTFMIAFEHFRKVYPNDLSRAESAATQLMEQVMVNYSQESRPLMYQNTGVIGESISPFAVFRNGYIGNTMLMAQAIIEKPSLHALKPMLVSQLTYLATAGLIGIIGANEYNMIVNFINARAPEMDLPTMEELIYKLGLPDWLSFGLLSTGTKQIPGLENGAYFGSSMNAVGGDDVFSSALAPFVTSMASILGLAGKEILSSMTEAVLPVSPSDYYKVGKQLIPPILQPYYEKSVMAPDSNVAPKSSSLVGGYEREPADWRAFMVTGRKSFAEMHETGQNRIRSENEKYRKATVSKLVDLGVEISFGRNPGVTLEELKRRAMIERVPPEEFAKKIVAERFKRMTPQKYRDLSKSGTASGTNNILDYNLLNPREE